MNLFKLISVARAAGETAAAEDAETLNVAQLNSLPPLLQFSVIFQEFWQSEWRVILIIIIAPLLQILVKLLSPLIIKAFVLSFPDSNRSKSVTKRRVHTLAGVINATSLVLIVGGVAWAVFSTLGVNMTPIITGAGILSLAVGFGAQSLVKDIIAGVFIILENQYNNGDWIKVDKYEGKVIEITLRRTILQTAKGARHIIPNGQIKAVTNNTNQYSAVSLDIPIRVDENFDKATKIIDQVGRKLAKEPKFKEAILDTPESVGVNEINENAAVIRVWGKAKPGKQIAVKRELAERIVREFSQKGIKLPGKIRH